MSRSAKVFTVRLSVVMVLRRRVDRWRRVVHYRVESEVEENKVMLNTTVTLRHAVKNSVRF